MNIRQVIWIVVAGLGVALVGAVALSEPVRIREINLADGKERERYSAGGITIYTTDPTTGLSAMFDGAGVTRSGEEWRASGHSRVGRGVSRLRLLSTSYELVRITPPEQRRLSAAAIDLLRQGRDFDVDMTAEDAIRITGMDGNVVAEWPDPKK